MCSVRVSLPIRQRIPRPGNISEYPGTAPAGVLSGWFPVSGLTWEFQRSETDNMKQETRYLKR